MEQNLRPTAALERSEIATRLAARTAFAHEPVSRPGRLSARALRGCGRGSAQDARWLARATRKMASMSGFEQIRPSRGAHGARDARRARRHSSREAARPQVAIFDLCGQEARRHSDDDVFLHHTDMRRGETFPEHLDRGRRRPPSRGTYFDLASREVAASARVEGARCRCPDARRGNAQV